MTVGVRAGARLGRIQVASGYARVVRTPRKKWLDSKRVARARKRVPIGAGRFGRVRSKVGGASGPGRDLDLDGIPGALDIDDDGDLILDNVDRSSAARALGRSSAARASVVTDQFLFAANLPLPLDKTANANARGLTVEQMDAALSGGGQLYLGILPGDSAELDCGGRPDPNNPEGWHGGLSYCTRGGSARFLKPGVPNFQPPRFPDAFDPDGDGFSTMTPSSPQPAPGSGQLVMGLSHGAKSAQIGTGDVLIQRVMRGGVESQFPAAMQYVATVPALVSFDDGQGNSATISYPVPASGPGTRGNGFPVKASANGDVMVTLTFWRPQRRPIPPEKGEWTDIGGLNYSAGAEAAEANVCPQSAFSTTDPTVRPLTPADVFPASYFGLRDLAPDRPASPASTFTFTLNLTSCLSGLSFDAGETQTFTFNAGTPNGTGGAQQQLSFKRQ